MLKDEAVQRGAFLFCRRSLERGHRQTHESPVHDSLRFALLVLATRVMNGHDRERGKGEQA